MCGESRSALARSGSADAFARRREQGDAHPHSSYGHDAQGQVAILEAIARTVSAATRLHIDVTHGFRHLSMVGLLSAELLSRLRPLTEVQTLWYGALDMTSEGSTPVLRLEGLQTVQHWISALDRFDGNNDYGVFEPLLLDDGFPADKARCLRKAALYESMSNVNDAALQLMTVLPELDKPLRGAGELFGLQIKMRLEWARLDTLYAQQRLLARRVLDRGDFCGR
ncbi:MAG: TIGR02221 family CRISPR-associated protein [Pseudomonadota bacterium]